MKLFRVTGLGIDTRTDNPIVLLHSDQDQEMLLPIWIGRLEAQSIAVAMQGEKMPRPMSHDLMISMLDTCRHSVNRIEIHSVQDGTFYANLVLEDQSNGELKVLDARPSDCIALALRSECDIYVSESVREQSCIPAFVGSEVETETPQHKQEDKEEFKRFLENVKASDFKLPPDQGHWSS